MFNFTRDHRDAESGERQTEAPTTTTPQLGGYWPRSVLVLSRHQEQRTIASVFVVFAVSHQEKHT
ncbi:hypothetical protein J6590_020226 [Homalodisca vitripennis]|nr:hypothetical protein J6590_020226 [Homalodisca vitripennis]